MTHRCCFDRYLPNESPYEYVQQGRADEIRAAALRNKFWEPVGRTLRVRFLDGDPAVQQKVIRFAQEWCQIANLIIDPRNKTTC